MKTIKPALILFLCFLLGMVTISLITGCDQQTAGLPQSPPIEDDDLIGAGDETPIDDIPDEQPADAGLGFELDEAGNPVYQVGSWAQWGGTS